MTINYPQGTNLTANSITKKGPTIFGDRGMTLEQEINESNAYYRNHKVAVIYKKPTPIQIVKVDYPKRSRAVIKEAYFRQASTTDYNGVYQGHYIDFEAKETRHKRSFPLSNFHEHQIQHLDSCLQQAGICFAIIKFVTLQRYFVLPAQVLIDFWQSAIKGGKKSIPLAFIEKKSLEIKAGYNPILPYLDICRQLINQTGENHG
ncbi:MAG: Holliday junction resolvase RecU [Lactobacillus sp.]|uniref:Holliday junction resolvase RecU n=1 Tax=Bombilactobacillus bombi TaxID=1303590 RepID=A0A347SR73_9LACO|nr:Holliday junction resolvase RecU [Bombilactobacillus bombi]MCO6541280.1 Holliday junction resolvase RecU [Lactobacillus sp.]MCO6542908.1 Holliday junction resolvase RecU [Lactobacillus sp.]RHW45970.1 Holliday junction resolvase RecU [Bombilactobacillus bombi]